VSFEFDSSEETSPGQDLSNDENRHECHEDWPGLIRRARNCDVSISNYCEGQIRAEKATKSQSVDDRHTLMLISCLRS
jgi:hypothetical protein